MSGLRMILPDCASIGCGQIHYRGEGIPGFVLQTAEGQRRQGGHSHVGIPSGFHGVPGRNSSSPKAFGRYERIPIHHDVI